VFMRDDLQVEEPAEKRQQYQSAEHQQYDYPVGEQAVFKEMVLERQLSRDHG
jgi:hypothetical protein